MEARVAAFRSATSGRHYETSKITKRENQAVLTKSLS